ncbi:30S ribosomal protein S20 [Patescibacteria group bacterium]
MPIKKAAKKYIRKTKTRTERNTRVKNRVKKLVKQARVLIEEGKTKEVDKALADASKALDKAAQKKVIHKNKARRLKKRLYKAKKKTKK